MAKSNKNMLTIVILISLITCLSFFYLYNIGNSKNEDKILFKVSNLEILDEYNNGCDWSSYYKDNTINFKTRLLSKEDYVYYQITLENSSDFAVEISSIIDDVDYEASNYLVLGVEGENIIKAHSSKLFTVKVMYPDGLNDSEYFFTMTETINVKKVS